MPQDVTSSTAEKSPRPYGLPPDWSGRVAGASALAGFVATLVLWRRGGGSVSTAWAPTLDLRLSFALDGLGAEYALLATGVGALVFAYGPRYLSEHLAHQHRPAGARWRFWPWMVLFAVAMVGLATAQDLVLLFVFFDLTALCSYFLIGFDRADPTARRAALTALLVTVAGAVAMLVAAVLLYADTGTFSIPALVQQAAGGGISTVAAVLLVVAAATKSAQVPFHFWLPRAMVAPTPVSAYLHSAAMVAAGVLVVGRLHPLLAGSEAAMTGLLVIGVASILVGGVLALGRDVLKQVLAYSTISQYGYVMMLYGIGGASAHGAAAFYVLAHALAKSALFMTAGAVTITTGQDRLSQLGGLWRQAPVLAVAGGVAAASLAGLPLTLGFFKDELLFATAREAGPLWAGFAVVAAGLTLAYVGRFWGLLFLGPVRTRLDPLPRSLTGPVVVLAVASVLGGLLNRPFAALAEDAGAVTNAAAIQLSPAYHLDARPENLMALAAWALAALLLAAPRIRQPLSHGLALVGDRFGPARLSHGAWLGLAWLSRATHRLEVRDLRTSIAAILVPAGVLVGLTFAVTPAGAYTVGEVSGGDWLVLPLLGLVALATLAVARTQARLPMVLALSVVGFALAAVYALVGAPDVALVAVVVDTMATLVFLAALVRVPRGGSAQSRAGNQPDPPAHPSHRWRNVLAGAVAGVASFAAIWGFLSAPTAAAPSVAGEYLRLAPQAHGEDVVTVIITDFRGLDTLAEVTVLALAVVTVATLASGRGETVEHGGVVPRVVARLLVGPSLMVAAALIVKAYTSVGDGFAAGMVVSLAIALTYVAVGAADAERALPLLRCAPALVVAGLAAALGAGFFPLVLGEPPFSHRPGPGAEVGTFGSLELFTPLLFDLGVFALVVGVFVTLLHQLTDPHSEADDPTAGHAGAEAPR